MTKLELMKHVSELGDDDYCSADGQDCRLLCPKSVNSLCGINSQRPARKLAALNEYLRLKDAQRREEPTEPERKKVWRFKTAEECDDGIRPGGWVPGMDYLLGRTLPAEMQGRHEDNEIEGRKIDRNGWYFDPEDAVYDYPIRS